MRKPFLALVLVAAALVAAAAFVPAAFGRGATRLRAFQALLIAGQEAEKPGSNAFGLAFFTLNESTHTIDYAVTVSGLSGAPTAMHLHGPAIPGVSAPVLVTLTAPADTTSQVTGTSEALTPQQIASLRKGLLYVNVHTAAVPAGEIRGQLVPVTTTYRVPASQQ